MPLDDDVRAYLRKVSALTMPAVFKMPVPLMRRAEDALKVRLAKRPPVGSVEDTTLDGPCGRLPARVYRPERLGDGAALCVYFHGGGFVMGSLASHDDTARRLCRELGAVVLSVGYRLAPEHRFPAAVDDAVHATRWALEHASRLGADPSRVYVVGDSAGGNLAAVAALELRGTEPPLAGAVLVYPVTDFRDHDHESRLRCETGYGLTREAMEFFRAQYLSSPEEREDPRASPLLAPDVSGMPPTFLVTCEFDPLCSEGEAFAARLRQAGVDVTAVRLAGASHGVFSAVEPLAATERLWEALRGWFGVRLRRAA